MILLLLASISSFSQNVTLDSITSKKVIIDLVNGDFCKKELVETKNILSLTEQKLTIQESLLFMSKGIISNQQELIKEQEKNIKGLNRKTLFWKIGAFASLGTALFFAAR